MIFTETDLLKITFQVISPKDMLTLETFYHIDFNILIQLR